MVVVEKDAFFKLLAFLIWHYVFVKFHTVYMARFEAKGECQVEKKAFF